MPIDPSNYRGSTAASSAVKITPPPNPLLRTAPFSGIPATPQFQPGTGTVPQMPFNPQYSPGWIPQYVAPTQYGTGVGVPHIPFNPQYSPNWTGAPLPPPANTQGAMASHPQASNPVAAPSPTQSTAEKLLSAGTRFRTGQHPNVVPWIMNGIHGYYDTVTATFSAPGVAVQPIQTTGYGSGGGGGYYPYPYVPYASGGRKSAFALGLINWRI